MSDQNESLDVSAKTVDEAIEQGLNKLGLSRDQVDIKILNEGKRGIFGLGSEDAVVRLSPKKIEREAPQPLDLPSAPPDDLDASLPAKAESEASPKPDMPGQAGAGEPDQLEKIAVEYLQELLQLMGIKAKVVAQTAPDLAEPGEEVPLVLDITGHDLGILIGRRTETLQAIQYMLRLMVSKQTGSWQRIVVDVESYRARRRNSLRQMAKRMAEKAVATRERVVMEAMSAYERRIIHMALRDHPAVFTKSIGRENNRKVTIIPK
jgi:spoIIIJ-associated protein